MVQCPQLGAFMPVKDILLHALKTSCNDTER